MWSAQAVRELKITILNAIYPPCVERDARNNAVGWHWNTHTHILKEKNSILDRGLNLGLQLYALAL